MTYEELIQRFESARAKIAADYASLTPAQRRAPRGRSERIREIRSAAVILRVEGRISIARLGISADDIRELASAGLVRCYPDRFRHLESVKPAVAVRA